MADLIFRVAIGGLIGFVSFLKISIAYRVLLGPILSKALNEDLIAGVVDRALHVGVLLNLGLLGFLQQCSLLNQQVFHLAFKLRAGRLTLCDSAVVDRLLLSDGHRFPVNLEGLQFSVGGAGRNQKGCAERNSFFIHDFCVSLRVHGRKSAKPFQPCTCRGIRAIVRNGIAINSADRVLVLSSTRQRQL